MQTLGDLRAGHTVLATQPDDHVDQGCGSLSATCRATASGARAQAIGPGLHCYNHRPHAGIHALIPQQG
jgi:hypothetical protein